MQAAARVATYKWLARYRSSVVGLDLSDDALRFCRESNRNGLIQASVADLPFADETFDLVTSFDVLVQLKEDDAEKAVREMHRVLRGSGVALVRVAAYEWMRSGHDVALGTQKRYRLDELTCLMERAGFEIARHLRQRPSSSRRGSAAAHPETNWACRCWL